LERKEFCDSGFFLGEIRSWRLLGIVRIKKPRTEPTNT